MQLVRTVFGLALLLGVFAQHGLADISLTLRNGRGEGGAQGYLPPSAQSLPLDEIINQAINDEIIKIQEKSRPHQFKQSQHGSSRYNILEVHNYQASQQQRRGLTHAAGPLNFNGDAGKGQQSTAPFPVPFPSNYQHNFEQDEQQYDNEIEQPASKAPDYLPPNEVASLPLSNEISHYSEAPKIAVPQQQTDVQELRTSTTFRGPEYLPPQAREAAAGASTFRGPDYLPPQHAERERQQHQQYGQHSAAGAHSFQQTAQHGHSGQVGFRGPDYLPPLSGSSHAEAQYNHAEAYHAPEYLPPHAEQPAQPISQPTGFKGPHYLPPNRESSQQLQRSAQALYKGPDYLPPQAGNVAAGGLLPSGYDFANPEERQQLPPPELPPPQLPLPFQFPPHSLPQHDLPGATQSTAAFAAPAPLPSGYDFEKPDNAEEAIAQLHSLQIEQQQQVQPQNVVVQSQLQVTGREEGSDIVYGDPKIDIRSSFSDNGYSPPQTNSVQPQANYQAQQGQEALFNVQSSSGEQQQHQQQQHYNLQQTSPQVFSPATSAELAAAAAAGAVRSHIQTLNSYMAAVQPFARYGHAQFTEPRRPFAEYGPPPAAAVPHAQPQQLRSIEVAPMYREQATRTQYYAPAMAYGSYAVAATVAPVGHTLSAHSRQSLQQFMPREIQQQIAAAAFAQAPVLQAAAAAAGKIRTVQIVNTNVVKTLKVLETLDHAGVKTIKILGPSNERPTGEHRVVKVVSEHGHGNEQHVQTVKIFNDQQEVPLTDAHNNNNAYLPPIAARKTRQIEQRRRVAAGRQRHR